MLAQRVPDVYDFGVLRHGIKSKMENKKHPGGTEKQRNKAFDEHAKKNAPVRTFTFSTEELPKEKERLG